METISPPSYDRALVYAHLERDEGRRRHVYADTMGNPTIGIGRNLAGRGLSDSEIDYLLRNDVALAELDLTRSLPWWTNLNPVRQAVLVEMAFNMGIDGLLTFRSTLADVAVGHWQDAAQGMRNSLWHRQVGARAERLADAMEHDEFP